MRPEWKKHRNPAVIRERIDGTRLKRTIRLNVAEYEFFGIAAALKRKPCGSSHEAMRAVATEDVRSTKALFLTVRMSKEAIDALLVGVQLGELDAALNRDAGASQVVAKKALGFRL